MNELNLSRLLFERLTYKISSFRIAARVDCVSVLQAKTIIFKRFDIISCHSVRPFMPLHTKQREKPNFDCTQIRNLTFCNSEFCQEIDPAFSARNAAPNFRE